MNQRGSTQNEKRPRQPRRLATWLRETLIRDVLLAAVVATIAGIVSGTIIANKQAHLDDLRSGREAEAAAELQAQTVRIENMRFLRERSSTSPQEQRPFGSLDFFGLTLGESLMLTGSDFSDSDLSEASMPSAQLNQAVFTRTKMVGAELPKSNLTGASLVFVKAHRIHMSGAILDGAYFSSSDLSGAFLGSVSAINSQFRDVNLIGAHLDKGDFRGANFSGSDLTGSDLTGICFDENTTWPEIFEPPGASADPDKCGANADSISGPAFPYNYLPGEERP